jgi:hypothetical protein
MPQTQADSRRNFPHIFNGLNVGEAACAANSGRLYWWLAVILAGNLHACG